MPSSRPDELIQALLAQLPEALQSYKSELAKHLESHLQNKLSAHGFVPRDEFDIQCAALARTEKRLAALEQTLTKTQKTQTKPQADTQKTSTPQQKKNQD